jgi:valyl-tRNA synthetase
MHPFMPHITEELWERMGFAKDGSLLMQTTLATEPVLADLDTAEASRRAAAIFEATGRARNLKAEYNLAANKKVSFVLEPAEDWMAAETETLRALIGAREIVVNPDFLPAANTPAMIASIGKMHMPIEGLIDVDAEKARLTKERDKAEKELQKVCAKLNDPNFTERAKKEIVEENKRRRQDFKARLTQLDEMLANLS